MSSRRGEAVRLDCAEAYPVPRSSPPVLSSVLARAAALALTLAVLAGCSGGETAADADLCTQYDDVVAQAHDMKSWEPRTDDVEDMRAAAEEFRTELDQLQAESDGRLDSAITSLRTMIDDFLSSAAAQGQEALDAVRPELEAAREEITEAWAVVEQVAENQCEDQ